MTPKKRVLIVDDDDAILEALDLTLASFGYDTKTLSEGYETYNAINQYKPDLLVLDLLLSGENGSEICKKIKKDVKTKRLPVIVVSAHPNLARLAKDCGADDYLEKPFDLDTLYKKVEDLTA